MAILPSIVYMFLGECREMSMGSFALTSLLVGSALETIVGDTENADEKELIKVNVSSGRAMTYPVVRLLLLYVSSSALSSLGSFCCDSVSNFAEGRFSCCCDGSS